MKIILKESQLKRIITELRSKSYEEKLMDMLLDKVGSEGIASLTPEEKDMFMKLSRGEDVDLPQENEPKSEYSGYEDEYGDEDDLMNEPESDMNDSLSLFLDIFPDGTEISSNYGLWKANIADTDSGSSLFLNNGEHEIEIIPFLQGDKLSINFKDKSWVLPIVKIPANKEEMKDFIDQFLKLALPKIINKLFNS